MYKKLISTFFVALLLLGFSFALQPATAAAPMVWAGCRASAYGISPYPSPAGWENAIKTMAGNWPGSIPSSVWMVGEIMFQGGHKDCGLQFPNPTPGVTYPNIIFYDAGIDHEAQFDYFDTHGVYIFLSCEPAAADLGTLIDLCMLAFQHHPCIIGWGIDVEWLKDADGKVSDAEAQAMETRLKSYNTSYKLWLKHWDYSYLPPTYRGDIIFNDDSQGFSNLAAMVAEFQGWAAHFYPNPVHYQVGYDSDKKWWKAYANPPKTLGDAIIAALPSDQQCGVYWVDFTLRDVLPTEPAGVMHVSDITMSYKKSGSAYTAKATVTVVDDGNVAVSGATVYGAWSGAWTGNVNGVTDATGKVTLSSGSVKGGGTFTFTVTNIVKTGNTYDPSKNVETSDTITLP